MTYAIFNTKTNEIEKDANGFLYIFEDKASAQSICDKLNNGGDTYKVKPA